MLVSDLLQIDNSFEVFGSRDKQVSSIEIDSRCCEKGSLFAAYKGIQVDGRQFISDAINKGAHVILAEGECNFKVDDYPDVTFIFHPQPRYIVALFLQYFYAKKPKHIAFVTGTNGKTSVAYYVSILWNLLGKNAASIGTLGVLDKSEKVKEITSPLTTPDVVTLHRSLANMADQGVEHVVIEASSHGLFLDRLAGIEATIAAWTNITRDHMDFHGDYSHYFQAKCRIFDYLVSKEGVAILNSDVAEYDTLSALCDTREIPWFAYGFEAAGLKMQAITATSYGQQIDFSYQKKEYKCIVPLLGKFQLYNVMCAVAVVLASGEKIEDIVRVMPQLTSVPGRMQWVATVNDIDAPVLVDYAHTPDALKTVLLAVKEHNKELGGKTVLVFGCGGDRDAGKRPLMGKIAGELADVVIITDDNPRMENPDQIRKEIMVKCEGCFQVPDRREAIEYGLSMLSKNDVLLIAGKGHETYQIIGEDTLPFNDAEVVREFVA